MSFSSENNASGFNGGVPGNQNGNPGQINERFGD
jgi:hypothetical protein